MSSGVTSGALSRPAVERRPPLDAIDVLGLGPTLTRHVNDEGDPDSCGPVFVESMYAWFDSCRILLARPS
ncbi:hypothetical protein [Streptomyces sp. NPDC088358]|uniref:hypothetical protein n=1 Tax=Streptomyces sp. NPDC088358 TaxID=3365857 RepID=UPI00382B53F0